MNSRLKEIRKAKNLNQEQFCEPLNISRSHLSCLEKGKRTLTKRLIEEICAKYNVNKEWFVNGVGEMFITESYDNIISELKVDDEIKDFMRIFLKADEETRKYVKCLIEKTISDEKGAN